MVRQRIRRLGPASTGRGPPSSRRGAPSGSLPASRLPEGRPFREIAPADLLSHRLRRGALGRSGTLTLRGAPEIDPLDRLRVFAAGPDLDGRYRVARVQVRFGAEGFTTQVGLLEDDRLLEALR